MTKKTNVYFSRQALKKNFKQINHQRRIKLVKKIIKKLSENSYSGERLAGKYALFV